MYTTEAAPLGAGGSPSHLSEAADFDTVRNVILAARRQRARMVVGATGRFIAGALRAVARFLDEQEDYRRLRDMDAYLLKDIGLSRFDVEMLANRRTSVAGLLQRLGKAVRGTLVRSLRHERTLGELNRDQVRDLGLTEAEMLSARKGWQVRDQIAANDIMRVA